MDDSTAASFDDAANDSDEDRNLVIVSLQDRFQAIKKAVRKATAEALQQSLSSVNQPFAKTPLPTTKTDNHPDTHDNPKDAVFSPENVDPNASFLLGMELFGQEPSVLERKVQEKLQGMEQELQQILNETKTAQTHDTTASATAPTISTATTSTLPMLQLEATRLAHKIQFLQACSRARALLDESMTASSLALSTEPNLALAAHTLAQAQQAIQNAEAILMQQEKKEKLHHHQEQQSPSQALLAAYKIVDSIVHPIRRQRLELISKATSLLESSITITSSSITVKGGGRGGVPDETQRNTNDDDHDDDGENGAADFSISNKNSSDDKINSKSAVSHGISAAFHVLAEFDEQGNTALHEALRKLTKRLYEQVFVPVLNEYRGEESNKNTNNSNFHSNKKSPAATTAPWIFEESAGRSNAGLKARLVLTNNTPTTGNRTNHLEWHRSDETPTMDASATETTNVLNTPIAAWKETFGFLQRILSFVHEHILLQRSQLTRLVGKRFFGKPDALPTSLSLEALGIQSTLLAEDHGMLTETIVELLNETCVPSHALTPEQVQELPIMADQLRHTVVGPFETFLVEASFVPTPDEADTNSSAVSRLGHFVQHLEQQYIDKRRYTILDEARYFLLHQDYHNTVEVGMEANINNNKKGTSTDDMDILDDDGMSVFRLHKCCISRTSSQLMELCRRTMEEAVEQSHVAMASAITNEHPNDNSNNDNKDEHPPLALLAPNLYRTARDILELFRAIIPSALGQEIATVPRTAALLHNDCVFFSHHCLTLGLEYKDRFPPTDEKRSKVGNLLRQTCMFVDMVPPFRELANRSMGDMLDLQKHQLVEIVGERIQYLGATLHSNESVAEWSEAETALTAGIYHLRHLSQAWRPILSQQVFSRSMGHLADAIFALYLEQVLSLQQASSSDISQSACHFISALFEKATRSIITALLQDDTTGSRLWDRFTAVGKFMDMNLADVEAALAQGVFRHVTGPELSRLIHATFADTDKRRNLLRLLVVD